MASDGELSPRRQADVRAHLDACWTCRERMRSLETAVMEFVRARSQNLDDDLPSAAGPQALFRARLAEAAASSGWILTSGVHGPLPRGRGSASNCEHASAFPRRAREQAVSGPLQPSPKLSATWRLAPAAAVFLFVVAAILIIFDTKVNAEGPKPKARLTPGETRPITIDEVCRTPQAEVITPNITEETRRGVFAAYGIDAARRGEFEVDYLITPDLGGSESVRNLWPQPYSARWNARVKDRLEQRLHQLVCEDKVDLTTAQHDIAVDWIGAYKKYVGTGAPH